MTLRRLLILNLLLTAMLVAGILGVRRSWKEFETNHRVQTVQPEKETVRSFPGAATIAAAAEDWTEISVKDPFSFDRNDVSIVAPRQAPVTQSKPVLFGTMSIGNERIAMLAPGQGGNRDSRAVKVGESLDDWKVVEIGDRSVVVTAANGVRETVPIQSPSAQERAHERTSSGTAAAAPVTVMNPSTPSPASVNSPTVTAAQPTQPGPAGQPAPEILNTPFGPVPKTKP